MKKTAAKDQHGIFQHFQSGVTDYNTREGYLAQRGGKSQDPKSLYGLGPEHPESYKPEKVKPGGLSTRYVPGRPGIQAMRVSTGVFQDPQTKEVFDYNEGFTTSDGRTFNGGGVDLQTDLATLANRLDSLGLVKEASLLDSVLFKLADSSSGSCEELAMTILSGVPWAKPHIESQVSGLVALLERVCGQERCAEINEYITNDIPNTMQEDMGYNDSADDSPEYDPQRSEDILQAALSSSGTSSKY